MALLGLALLVFAVPTPPAVGLDVTYTPTSWGPVMLVAAAFALPVTTIIASMAWRWSGRRMVDHRICLMVVPVMAAGLWQMGYAAVVCANGEWDRAVPTVVDTPIKAKFGRPTGTRTMEYPTPQTGRSSSAQPSLKLPGSATCCACPPGRGDWGTPGVSNQKTSG